MKTSVLVVTGGVTGLGIGILALLLRKETNSIADKTPFVRKAVKLAQEQPQIREILGDNIKAEPAYWDRNWSLQNDRNMVKVSVPLMGDKDKGNVFVYAKRKAENERLRLKRIEMSFDSVKNKKLILMDLADDETIDDGVTPSASELLPKERPKTDMFDYTGGQIPKGLDLKRAREQRKAKELLEKQQKSVGGQETDSH